VTIATVARPAFWAHAACADLPADLFHPERGESTKEAKAVCATCLVRLECLEWAVTRPEKFGIWGGRSERERRRLRGIRARGLPDPAPPDDTPPTIDHPDEEEPAVELTIVDPPAPAPTSTNGHAGLLPDRPCDHCGTAFTPVRKDQRFHTKECARAWYSSHKASAGGRRPRSRPARARAIAPVPSPSPVPARPDLTAAAGPVDLQALLGQLLAGCERWTVEADLGDVHVTVSRQPGPMSL